MHMGPKWFDAKFGHQLRICLVNFYKAYKEACDKCPSQMTLQDTNRYVEGMEYYCG